MNPDGMLGNRAVPDLSVFTRVHLWSAFLDHASKDLVREPITPPNRSNRTMKRTILLPIVLVSLTAAAQQQPIDRSTDLAQAAAAKTAEAASAIPAFQAGLLALKGERPKEAIASFSQELSAHPDNEKAWYYRGVCQQQIGDATAAMHDLDRALRIMPMDANALLRRSEVHAQAHDYAGAISDLNSVLGSHQAGPIAEHALMSLGQLGIEQGDFAAALAAYDRLVIIAPKDARSWYDRGIAHAQNNEHQKAYEDLTEAIHLDGWMEKAYGSRAIELIHLDRTAEACSDLNKAKDLGDDSVDELRAIYCE